MAEDIISSSPQSADPSSLTPSLHHQKSHLHAQHLNPNYEMPEGNFDYIQNKEVSSTTFSAIPTLKERNNSRSRAKIGRV
jgi:hypothetical protein